MATVAAGPDPSGNRLTALTDDNHQPWLWFVEIFSCFCVVGAGGLRFWIRRKNYGSSDIVLAVAYVSCPDLHVDCYGQLEGHC